MKPKCKSFSGRGLQSAESCQVRRLTGGERVLTSDPYVREPRRFPSDHSRLLIRMKDIPTVRQRFMEHERCMMNKPSSDAMNVFDKDKQTSYFLLP